MLTFRLDREPWIPVVGADGLARHCDLVQVFANASSISHVGGSPLEVAAITRFLLAIVHLTETPTTLESWSKLWRDRAALMDRCAEYVRRRSGTWDLFDASCPFGQMPGLKKTVNPAHLLLYEASRKNNALLLDHSTETAPLRIPAPNLVRGLITANAYAGSSGGGYRSGPLAMRSVAILSAAALDATLVLNLVVQREPPADYDWNSYGRPSTGRLEPIDVVRRYLWTSRRLRLIPDDDAPAASTMLLAPGDELSENERSLDPMVVMRKDSKGTAYVPFRLETGRALWRSAHVLLNWQEGAKCVAAVGQLHKLLRRGHFPRDYPVSMRVCAVAGEAQGPTTELWRDELLPFGVSVVADEQRYAELVRAVSAAEDRAKATRRRVYAFAARYLQGSSGSQPDEKDVGRLTGELTAGPSDLWAALAPIGDRIACDGFDETEWGHRLSEASAEAFRRAVDRLPANAHRYRAQFAGDYRRAGGPRKGTKA
ncbi:MAG: hypothetical protein A49_26730 [Methyloceanibacter sp.]|nr:MAG: hypothetical protein A49_26730 [Methyloceanibacter sp.]